MFYENAFLLEFYIPSRTQAPAGLDGARGFGFANLYLDARRVSVHVIVIHRPSGPMKLWMEGEFFVGKKK